MITILYDANESQICKICGEMFSHNRQGRFTSHLKQIHQIDLDEYLKKYWYDSEDIQCGLPDCPHEVRLRRGIPNDFCSTTCKGKARYIKRERSCIVCHTIFSKEDLRIKTCRDSCAKEIMSEKAKVWFRTLNKDHKEKHFSDLNKKRRKRNVKVWNKGKTGIYSKETLAKIREATLKQLASQGFRKTNIERIMESFLKDTKIRYQYSYILEHRQFDFYLPDYHILIECDGDYWHANPKFYPDPDDRQKERQQNDLEKNEIARQKGYQLLRFWGDDILNRFDEVEKTIRHRTGLLATT